MAYQWLLPGTAAAQQVRTGATISYFMPGYVGRAVRPYQAMIPFSPGMYSNPQRPGNGIDLFPDGVGNWLIGWYTYEARTGEPIWYYSDPLPIEGATWYSPLYRTTWSGSSYSRTQIGSVALAFSNPATAWFSWDLNGLVGGERVVHVGGGAGRSGAWYVPTEPGWSYEVQESGSTLTTTVPSGAPR